ncbi:tryptophan halogenase [Steroidobacter agaridevorans]|uniref:Tryptophan halogenase n=1 Tax=Steroidobacter agaridevorans TaxID=2695856 RepID=A0A829YI22_9GAMM|nr:tryptophan 7-halogenase [Steroidobacter agaridevorans]GFE82890.1 tryptophan halogenase [Steroidobacter agaridevorans]GFE85980.1 tryptophan halogenase [Steroidobacter agaridevorans]
MSESRVNTVVVVGRDLDLWLSACVLKTALHRSGVSVTAVELPTHLHASDVYATLPAMEALHNLLRIEEAEMLASTRSVFSLGQNFIAHGTGQAYFHAYGAYGAAINTKPFFPHWLRARELGANVSFEDFSLTAATAKHGRMLIPDRATESYGRTDYAYHLPAIDYVRFLKRLAQQRGVTTYQSTTAKLTQDPLTEDISAVTLDDERHIGGHLFIDATGPEALLIGATLKVPRESWSGHSPVDRVIVASSNAFASIPPYAEVRAHANGWVGLYPSRSCTQVIQAYSSDICTANDALDSATTISRLALRDAFNRTCAPGIRSRAWERNCVAIGGAACTFDPVHSVDVHAVHLGLVHLLSLFPAGEHVCAAERAEFNRVTRQAFERLRDFQSAHYLLNRYEPSAFWSRAREITASTELAHKIATFRARGEMPLYEHETFSLDSWLAQFIGQGEVPETHDPTADCTPPDVLKAELKSILRFIKDKVLEQTPHDAYLKRLQA